MSAAGIRTSVVNDALLACHERLNDLEFSQHSDTGDKPVILFGGEFDEEALETVRLVGKVDDLEATWVTIGAASREERFALLIEVEVLVPSSMRDAVLRLKEVQEPIEVAFRDQSTGQPIPLDLGGNELTLGGFDRIEIDLGLFGDQGYAAKAEMYLTVVARI